LQPLTEIFAVEQLHRDVGRPLEDAVIEDLHDVRASERCGRLRFALESRLRLGDLRKLPLDELHGARDVEPEVRRVPNGTHPAAAEEPVQVEALCDDDVRCELDAHSKSLDVPSGDRNSTRRARPKLIRSPFGWPIDAGLHRPTARSTARPTPLRRMGCHIDP